MNEQSKKCSLLCVNCVGYGHVWKNCKKMDEKNAKDHYGWPLDVQSLVDHIEKDESIEKEAKKWMLRVLKEKEEKNPSGFREQWMFYTFIQTIVEEDDAFFDEVPITAFRRLSSQDAMFGMVRDILGTRKGQQIKKANVRNIWRQKKRRSYRNTLNKRKRNRESFVRNYDGKPNNGYVYKRRDKIEKQRPGRSYRNRNSWSFRYVKRIPSNGKLDYVPEKNIENQEKPVKESCDKPSEEEEDIGPQKTNNGMNNSVPEETKVRELPLTGGEIQIEQGKQERVFHTPKKKTCDSFADSFFRFCDLEKSIFCKETEEIGRLLKMEEAILVRWLKWKESGSCRSTAYKTKS